MSICYSLRITPIKIDPSGSQNPGIFILIFKELIYKYSIENYALGYEKLNKYGEKTHPHFHFNFLSDAKKETIAAYIRRMDGWNIKGKEMYALSVYPDPDDYDRWFRYVAKEKLIRKFCSGFTEKQLDEMELLAKDERARAIKYNIEKRELLLKKSTLYERYSKELCNSLQKNEMDYKSIWLGFLKLYIRDLKVINPSSITGYTFLFQLQQKVISEEEFFAAHNKNKL